MQLTPRQQRRLQQKLARKAQKKTAHPATHAEPEAGQAVLPVEDVLVPQTSEAKLLATGLTGASTPESSEGFAGTTAQAGTCPSCPPEQARAVAGPVSAAKIAANRINAQLSTGATTEEGKAIVSQNATKHGLTGTFRVLPDESQADFDRLVESFMRSEEPADDSEVLMVHQMAEALWLSKRSVRFQDRCFIGIQSGTPEQQRLAHKQLALFMRYQTAHDRTFTRYATELRKRRNERRRIERGFVSQKRAELQQARRAELDKQKQELHELKVLIQKVRLQRIHAGKKTANLASNALTNPTNSLAMAA